MFTERPGGDNSAYTECCSAPQHTLGSNGMCVWVENQARPLRRSQDKHCSPHEDASKLRKDRKPLPDEKNAQQSITQNYHRKPFTRRMIYTPKRIKSVGRINIRKPPPCVFAPNSVRSPNREMEIIKWCRNGREGIKAAQENVNTMAREVSRIGARIRRELRKCADADLPFITEGCKNNIEHCCDQYDSLNRNCEFNSNEEITIDWENAYIHIPIMPKKRCSSPIIKSNPLADEKGLNDCRGKESFQGQLTRHCSNISTSCTDRSLGFQKNHHSDDSGPSNDSDDNFHKDTCNCIQELPSTEFPEESHSNTGTIEIPQVDQPELPSFGVDSSIDTDAMQLRSARFTEPPTCQSKSDAVSIGRKNIKPLMSETWTTTIPMSNTKPVDVSDHRDKPLENASFPNIQAVQAHGAVNPADQNLSSWLSSAGTLISIFPKEDRQHRIFSTNKRLTPSEDTKKWKRMTGNHEVEVVQLPSRTPPPAPPHCIHPAFFCRAPSVMD